MGDLVQLNLAVILFLPWYAILAVLYWVYPRQPRTRRRWCFDVGSLAIALLATVGSTQWSVLNADTSVDAIWPQVLATAVSYGVFLAVMTAAFLLRRRLVIASFRAHAARDGRPSPVSGARP
jgi:hypothetical protein